ncbi:hypothetical protein TURU_015614 [Turdus rufiventris]|nr:hypothetical protein TURU_015614 [Turdus rufiventris]
MSVSAFLSRDADAGTGHLPEQVSQQEEAGLSVHIECHQSPLWHGPVLKEVIMSFKRRPSEEPDRSFQAHGSPQQQDGLEDRDPQSQEQDSSLRHCRALNVTAGQVSANDRLGRPETGWDRSTNLAWRISYTTPQQPQVTGRRFTEGTINNQVPPELLGAQAASSEPVGWTKEQKCEDTIVPELYEEEWEDAVDTALDQGADDTGDEGEDGIVTPAAQEEVGKEAAARPDQGQAFSYSIPFSTFLDALAEESQMWRRKAVNVLQKALIAAQGKGEQKRQRPRGSTEVLPEPAQSIGAEHLDRNFPVKQGHGQLLEVAEADLEVHTKEVIEAGRPAGPAFRSPSPTVIDALAQERRTSVFKSAPRALPSTFSAMHRRGEQEQQQSTACAQDLPDTAQGSEVLRKATAVTQGLKRTEEQEYLEHSRDATGAVRARVAGAVSMVHGPHSPTADGLGIRVTAPAEGTERPGHTVHSRTAEVPIFLEHNDCIQTEVVKKADLAVQKPFQYPEEEQDQDLSTEESIGAKGPADHAQSLSTSVVIHTLAQLRWLKLVSRAIGVWDILRALRLAAAATSDTEKEEKEKQLTADAMDVIHIAEHVTRNVQDKAAPEMHASSQQIGEEQGMEHSRDVSLAVTSTAAASERQAHETHSSRADALVFLDYYDYIRTEVVKKAMLVVQKPFEYPEEQQEQELSAEQSTMAERPADCAQSLPAPMVINTSARQRWLRLVRRSLRALHLASNRTSSTEEKKKQPRADDTNVLDTDRCIRRDVQEATLGMHALSQQTVEQEGMKYRGNVSSALTPPAAGAERQTHKTRSPRADAPVFLDYNDCIHTEVIKKAMLMVQKPFQHPEEEQDQELSTEEATGAEGPADHAQSLPESTVIHTPSQLRSLRRVSRAQEVWRVLRTLHLATATTSDTGKEEQENQPTADARDVLHIAEHIRTKVQDRAALGMHACSQQNVEQ